MTLPRPLPKYDVKTDSYPTDDYYIDRWERSMLNRIDQEYGCDVPLYWNVDVGNVPCGLPEWDPFTHRCADHSPDNGGWNA